MLATVVVSFNTSALLRDCLTSVLESLRGSGLAGEVWVVDNASSDGSPEMVQEEFPSVHLIANSENRGFAAANNQALQAIGLGDTTIERPPKAVFLLNPDTLVRSDALGKMYDALMKAPHVGVVGSALTYPDGGFQHSAFRFPDLLQVFFDFFPINHRMTDSRLNGRYPRALYQRGAPFPIDHPLGAAFIVRGEAIRRVGLLDERFFIYCEEIDWCMRFKKGGWQIICVPQARIVHYAGQSTQQLPDEMFVALWKSRFLLFEKHYPPLYRWAVRSLVSVGMKHKVRQVRAALSRGEMGEEQLELVESAQRRIMEM